MLSLLIFVYLFMLLGYIFELGIIEKGLFILYVFVMVWWFGVLLLLK